MEDSPRWVKVVQEQERELKELRATLSRTEADKARLRLALSRALAILELDAPMRAREILELRKELRDE